MSWDKNTVITSGLGAVREALETLGVPYNLTKIGSFKGRGLNDDIHMEGNIVIYELHRLEFGTQVILEYAELDADCDIDDFIRSKQFDLVDETKDWEPVRYTDVCGEYPDWKGVP